MDEWISKYIRHDKNITNEYPNKFAHEKISEYFWEWIYLSKIFECIRISDYFPKIILDYFGHFHMLCYFVPLLIHFGPIINDLITFGKQWKFKYIRYHRYWTNEYPNILFSINIWRMNIRIYSPWKKLMNIWKNEYICLNIFEYLSHTDLRLWLHRFLFCTFKGQSHFVMWVCSFKSLFFHSVWNLKDMNF